MHWDTEMIEMLIDAELNKKNKKEYSLPTSFWQSSYIKN